MTLDLNTMTAPTDAGTNGHGLPSWVTEIRPHQATAVREIVEAFDAGVKVVFLDAPTGSGKTLIGELVRRELNKSALYVCSSLTLQDQILRDFPYARVIKGRANYPVFYSDIGADRTAADCTLPDCGLCPSAEVCPYTVAKRAAVAADLAVLNTTYMLYETNKSRHEFGGRALVIADECDLLESELMRFIELDISARTFADCDVQVPPKGIHYKTLQRLLEDSFLPAVSRRISTLKNMPSSETIIDRLRHLNQVQTQVKMVAKNLTDGNWVRDSNRDGGLVMKPISVAGYGQSNIWKHGDQFLCMSASIISADQMATDLGLADHEWELVTVPMTFPVENRPITAVGIANLKRDRTAEDEAALIEALVVIRRRHPDERILVHSVSYELTKLIVDGLHGHGVATISYSSTAGRAKALKDYRKSRAGMMVAPSMDRGVDFKGDECRVVVICKVPFPYLGDPQISGRMHAYGGRDWYQTQTIRTLVQMTGRGVRSADDHAHSYILDKQFLRIHRENKRLFPKWWLEALNAAVSTKQFRTESTA